MNPPPLTASKHKTFSYTQDGRTEGPYFELQIRKMVESGVVRADAEIRCLNDGMKVSILDFMHADPRARPRTVTVTDFDMPMGSMVSLMVKWVIASIPAAIILCIIGFMVLSVFGMLGGMAHSLSGP